MWQVFPRGSWLSGLMTLRDLGPSACESCPTQNYLGHRSDIPSLLVTLAMIQIDKESDDEHNLRSAKVGVGGWWDKNSEGRDHRYRVKLQCSSQKLYLLLQTRREFKAIMTREGKGFKISSSKVRTQWLWWGVRLRSLDRDSLIGVDFYLNLLFHTFICGLSFLVVITKN